MAVAAERSADHAAEGVAAAFVQRFEEAWSRSAAEPLLELLTDDVVLRAPMMPTTVGKQAARAAFLRVFTAFPGLHVTVHEWAAREEILFIDFTASCTFGGRELSWRAVDRFVLRDGAGAERTSYFDALPILIKVLASPRGWGGLFRARIVPYLR